jgi:hypothetical protein
LRDRPAKSNSLPLSGLTGRDQYLVSLALAASIALLDRAPIDNWQASSKTDMETLLAGMITESGSFENIKTEGDGLVRRALSASVNASQDT